mmetsp:Transcript_62286/g.175591  ORF Transcript_62286/g.175591 Transcript_62286/m.175591 type:complete len:215 (+) Transcript_62286:162-806(+)
MSCSCSLWPEGNVSTNFLNTFRMYSMCWCWSTVFCSRCCMFISRISDLTRSFSFRAEPCCCLSSWRDSSSCRTWDRKLTRSCQATDACREYACVGRGWRRGVSDGPAGACSSPARVSAAGSATDDTVRGLDFCDGRTSLSASSNAPTGSRAWGFGGSSSAWLSETPVVTLSVSNCAALNCEAADSSLVASLARRPSTSSSSDSFCALLRSSSCW